MSLPHLLAHVQTHVALSAAALSAGSALGVPLGVLAARLRGTRGAILGLVNVGRVIPSLAVLTFVVPILGVGFKPALVALALLAIPPIAINTDLGLRGVPPAALDVARGVGMTAMQAFARVEWPLALPVVLTGVRTAAIEVIASATLAAFVGAGGLGEYILRGLQAGEPALLLAGAGSVALLALAAEFTLTLAARRAGERTA
ncbi:MAG: ABC transporter permease [Vulcanimicrobiaceae bacterium]